MSILEDFGVAYPPLKLKIVFAPGGLQSAQTRPQTVLWHSIALTITKRYFLNVFMDTDDFWDFLVNKNGTFECNSQPISAYLMTKRTNVRIYVFCLTTLMVEIISPDRKNPLETSRNERFRKSRYL